MKLLKTIFLAVTTTVLLSACMGLPFEPKTDAGVQCKVDCGFRANDCIGSPMNCDNAHRRCINGCRDIDTFELKKQQDKSP